MNRRELGFNGAIIAVAGGLISCGVTIGGASFGNASGNAKGEGAEAGNEAPQAGGAQFAGVYRGVFGEITLVDDGGTPAGTYTPNNGKIRGCNPSSQPGKWLCVWVDDQHEGLLRLWLNPEGKPDGAWGTNDQPEIGGTLGLRQPTADDGPPEDTRPELPSKPARAAAGGDPYGGACSDHSDCPGSVRCLCPKGTSCSSGRRCATSPGWYCTNRDECGGGRCNDGKCSNSPEGSCLTGSDCPGGECSHKVCKF